MSSPSKTPAQLLFADAEEARPVAKLLGFVTQTVLCRAAGLHIHRARHPPGSLPAPQAYLPSSTKFHVISCYYIYIYVCNIGIKIYAKIIYIYANVYYFLCWLERCLCHTIMQRRAQGSTHADGQGNHSQHTGGTGKEGDSKWQERHKTSILWFS